MRITIRFTQAYCCLFVFGLFAVVAEEKKPLDLAPYEAHAKKIELAIKENDAKQSSLLLDQKSFMDRVFDKVPGASAEFRRGFEIPFKGGAFNREIFSEWAKSTANGGCCKLLRVKLLNGEPRAVFRSVGPQGLNYIEFIYATDNGPVRVIDLYVLLTAENMSDTMARLVTFAVADLPNSGQDKEQLRHVKTMQEFFRLVRSRVPDKALELYASLPEKYQQNKIFMLMQVQARMQLMEVDPDAYTTAFDEFAKKYPNEASLDLMSLDSLLLRMQFESAHKVLDRVEIAYGPDNYLKVLRTALLLQEKKFDKARQIIESVVKDEPELVSGFDVLAKVALQQKDYKRLVEVITILESKFNLDFSNVPNSPEFADFRESPEFKNWWKSRGN